ncbi:MAG: DUF4255 domain-containing protein [Acidobacteriota bacterium]|jgi:hypothetical protein
MSLSTVIGDVTHTLEQLLTSEQSPAGLFDVSLRLPAEDAAERITSGMRPKVNLYIFLVQENQTAKNRDWRAVGTNALHKPPLTLDLYYVMTTFAENLLDEHRVLGEAMRVLYDHAVIAPEHLQGALPQVVEDLKLDLCAFDIEELTRIWNAFNQPYRLSVCYRVRIVHLESALERPVRRVTEKVEDYGTRG